MIESTAITGAQQMSKLEPLAIARQAYIEETGYSGPDGDRDHTLAVAVAKRAVEIATRVSPNEVTEEIEGLLRCLIDTVKSTAFEIPAPNDWTPRFMQIATSAESFLARIKAKETALTAMGLTDIGE